MVVVVWADLLYELVVCTEEVNVDADDLEGLGAKPGNMALGLLLEAYPVREVAANRRPLAAVRLLVFHPTIEGLIVFRYLYGFLLSDLKIDSLGGRDQTDGHITQAGGIVAEIYAEGSVAVVNNLPSNEKVELDRFDV